MPIGWPASARATAAAAAAACGVPIRHSTILQRPRYPQPVFAAYELFSAGSSLGGASLPSVLSCCAAAGGEPAGLTDTCA
eukprot:365827-Chlamydomonas_euryale.AAC.3